MVVLIENNENPTSRDIDEYLYNNINTGSEKIDATIREIYMKQNILHPSEQYFAIMYENIRGMK